MHPGLEQLIPLQRLDLDLRKLNEELAAAPARIASLAARSAQAQAELLHVQEAVAAEDKLRRSHESEIHSLRDRAAKLQAQTSSVTNQAQATALEHQLAHTRAEISRLEDEELVSMERTESLQPRLAPAQEAVAASESHLENERLASADRDKVIRERMAELQAERNEIRTAVEATNDSLLSTYDRISRNRGTALAEGVDQKCSACQMLIRPQRWAELRDRSRQEDLFTCESCGRLLYWDPSRDAPQKRPQTSAGATAQRKPPTTSAPQDPKDRPDFGTGSIASRIIRGY